MLSPKATAVAMVVMFAGPAMAQDLTDSFAAIEQAIACQEETSGG